MTYIPGTISKSSKQSRLTRQLWTITGVMIIIAAFIWVAWEYPYSTRTASLTRGESIIRLSGDMVPPCTTGDTAYKAVVNGGPANWIVTAGSRSTATSKVLVSSDGNGEVTITSTWRFDGVFAPAGDQWHHWIAPNGTASATIDRIAGTGAEIYICVMPDGPR